MSENNATSEALKFTLSSAVTIDNVEALSAEIKKQTQHVLNAEFVIDASKVEVITTPGVQLLFSVSKKFEKADSKLRIENPTEVFCRAFEFLGLADSLKSWSVSNG